MREYRHICPTCNVERVVSKGVYYRFKRGESKQCRKCSYDDTWRANQKASMNTPAMLSLLKNNGIKSKQHWQPSVCYSNNPILYTSIVVGMLNKEYHNALEYMEKKLIRADGKGKYTRKYGGNVYIQDDWRMNIRNKVIADLRSKGIWPGRNYNRRAITFIEDRLNRNPWNLVFRHALDKDGEFECRGYFADGYNAEHNLWFEYDEPHHYYSNGQLREKDRNRMEEIKRHLGCKFLRYNEKNRQLKYYN
jgi:hypothetical protein